MEKSGSMKAVIVGWLVFLVVATAAVDLAAGQTQPYQTCTSTFFSTLVQLMPCRPAVSLFSPSPPSEACCSAIKTLGQPCLCRFITGPPITGVDRNMALQLPVKCTANFEPCDGGR